VALGVLVYALAVHLTGHSLAPGWTSLMVTVTFLGGVQLLSLGVLGAYVGRIYAECQNRPLFLVAETHSRRRKQAPVNRVDAGARKSAEAKKIPDRTIRGGARMGKKKTLLTLAAMPGNRLQPFVIIITRNCKLKQAFL
jgi:hypothetical protein